MWTVFLVVVVFIHLAVARYLQCSHGVCFGDRVHARHKLNGSVHDCTFYGRLVNKEYCVSDRLCLYCPENLLSEQDPLVATTNCMDLHRHPEYMVYVPEFFGDGLTVCVTRECANVSSHLGVRHLKGAHRAHRLVSGIMRIMKLHQLIYTEGEIEHHPSNMRVCEFWVRTLKRASSLSASALMDWFKWTEKELTTKSPIYSLSGILGSFCEGVFGDTGWFGTLCDVDPRGRKGVPAWFNVLVGVGDELDHFGERTELWSLLPSTEKGKQKGRNMFVAYAAGLASSEWHRNGVETCLYRGKDCVMMREFYEKFRYWNELYEILP